MTTSTDQHAATLAVLLNLTACEIKSHMFGAPSAAVASLIFAAPVWEAMAAVRPEFGRIAASAHAWDTNGGAPSFQAYLCTGNKTAKTLNSKKNTAKTLVKTVAVKTNKRPQSWCGPPNG